MEVIFVTHEEFEKAAWESTAERMRSLKQIMISQNQRRLMYLRRWWIRLSENTLS